LLATIGINPEGWGCHVPKILGWGLWRGHRGSWTGCVILLYLIIIMKEVCSKVVTFQMK